jgi:preprotein translocase subunit SecA
MMDRIEDETVRYLFFLQVSHGAAPAGPYPDEDEEQGGPADPEPDQPKPNRPDAAEQQRQAAKAQMEDFTRNIQRKKEKELRDLQFVGGDGSTSAQPASAGQKVGRNDPCPCGSGRKYKKCHGAG